MLKISTFAGVIALLLSQTAVGADLFYEQRLKTGQSALAAKQYVEAAQELRIAAFGLLDEPKRLAETLALLALAHASIGKTEDVQQTIERFVDIETRFNAYDRASLEPAYRTQFESLLIRAVPRQTLSAIPSLAPLIQPAAPKTPQKKGAEPARRPPAQVLRPAPAPSPAPPTATATTSASAPASTPAPIPTPAPGTTLPVSSSKETMDAAAKLVGARRFADAVYVLSEAVGRDGSNRELRLMLMQSAALAKNWPVAAAQVPLVSPFSDSESVAMFYAAISLYETGRLTDAREILNRALPRLRKSPFVEDYTTRIIGTRSGS